MFQKIRVMMACRVTICIVLSVLINMASAAIDENREANALLKWKATLDNKSQLILAQRHKSMQMERNSV
ncbi:hypothetical protein S245_014072 [Arachis hypogaea]